MTVSPHRTWRESDLRGSHGPPPVSVTAVVRHVHLALAAARWGESVLFLVAGLCVTLAAAAVSGASLERWDVWAAALLGGACAGLSWGIEHFEKPLDVARALDSRLRHLGGLVTAYELENRGERTSMAGLVIDRTRARLRAREAVRALFPPLALPVAAPLLGAGLLALALESRKPDVPEQLDLAAWTRGMVAALGSSYDDALNADEDGSLDGATARDVIRVVNRLEDLERRAATLQERPDDALRELRTVDEALAELTPRLAGQPELAQRMEAARNWLDTARMGLAAAAGAGPEGGPEGGAGGTETAAAGEGTMAGSTERGEGAAGVVAPDAGGVEGGPPETGAVVPAAADAGTTAESWWPAEYDRIVASWIELRRRAPAEPSRAETPDGKRPAGGLPDRR